MSRVAIIGAGLAGLTLAKKLSGFANVTVFEKSRGFGGRMATRRSGRFEFDHGAQFFTARSRSFQTFLKPLIEDGVVAHWRAVFAELDGEETLHVRRWEDHHPHYVGVPGMNAIGKSLSRDVDVRLEHEVVRVHRDAGFWRLEFKNQPPSEPYDWLITTAPAAQSATLVSKSVELTPVPSMSGCFAMLLGFNQPLPLEWQAALVKNADISWIAVNSSKPGRPEACALVIHSTNAWADQHMDDGIEFVAARLLREGSRVIGQDLGSADHIQIHRWRYANLARQTGPGYVIDDGLHFAACGDWCVRGRVEAAFLSASRLSSQLHTLL